MTERIPVLLLVRELNLGGIENDVSKLARHLDSARFIPHVASYLPSGVRMEELCAAGVPVLHLPVHSIFSVSAFRAAARLRRYIRQHRIQIVHAFDLPTDIFSIPVARVCRVPVTVASQLWVHAIEPARVVPLLNCSYRLATAVYANCEAVRSQLVNEKKIDPRRVFVCYNGVDSETFHPGGRVSRPGTVTVGTVAVMRPIKDLGTLVRAFAMLRARHSHLRLLLAGDGPMRPELEDLCRRLTLQDVVQILPPPPNVAALMRSLDVFVSCSHSEAFSNAILEAMACGCCPVGSRVGGTPELIREETTGLLFEAGDAAGLAAVLDRLACDEALRTRLAATACRTAHEKLGIQAAASRLADVYTRLLQYSRHGGTFPALD